LGANNLAASETLCWAIFFSHELENRYFTAIRIYEPIFVYAVDLIDFFLFYSIPLGSRRREDFDYQSRHNLEELTLRNLGTFAPTLA
jgi:hypothetical protein